MPEETNAERLEGLEWVNAARPLTREEAQCLIEQVKQVQGLESLLEGSDGMSVKEIRHQFVDLHRSSLNLEKENKRLREALEEVKEVAMWNGMNDFVYIDITTKALEVSK